jgi:hypothetical protein
VIQPSSAAAADSSDAAGLIRQAAVGVMRSVFTDREARMGDRIHEGAYSLTWSDEFDGAPGTPADRGTWQAETGGSGWGNQELQYYTGEPGNAALDGAGNLALAVRRVTRNWPAAGTAAAGTPPRG